MKGCQSVILAACAGLMACGTSAPTGRDDGAGGSTAEDRGGVTLLYGDGDTVDPDTANADPDTVNADSADTAITDPADTATATGPGWVSLEDEHLSVLLDPYGYAPLAAIVKVGHPAILREEVTALVVSVAGLTDDDEPLTAVLAPQSEAFGVNFDMSDKLEEGEIGIPILGLFPDAENRVAFEVRTKETVYRGAAVISTPPVLDLAEETVTLTVSDPVRTAPGWTYLNTRVYDGNGRCRWFGRVVYRILENGNFLSGPHEWSWLGKIVHRRVLPPYLAWHHDGIELPNGNVVLCARNTETTLVNGDGETVDAREDYIIELDRETDEVVNAWNLTAFLDVDRYTISRIGPGEDWFHLNTLAYDAHDDSILVSGRYQGVIKLSRGGIQGEEANKGKALRWILAPHLDWGLAGPSGEGPLDPKDTLLTAVDSRAVPYSDAVQDNLAVPPADREPFFWPLGQHGLEVTSRTDDVLTFLTFSNYAHLIFDGPGSIENGVTDGAHGDPDNDRSGAPFSQIIEYEVDEAAMTVRRRWSFGEERPELFGSYMCGVNRVGENRLMITNGIDTSDRENNPFNSHVVELTPDGEEVFHLEIENTEMSALRAGRVDLYHPARSFLSKTSVF